MQLATDDDGNNLFHALGARGEYREATKLLSSTTKKAVSAGLVARNKSGMTPLHIAADAGNIRVLTAFIEAAPEESDNIKSTDGFIARDLLVRKFESSKHQYGRFITLDKMGLEAQQFETGPVDAHCFAVSNNSMVMIGQPQRHGGISALFTVIKGVTRQVQFAHSGLPVLAATSNKHSLVLTSNGHVYAWGKNVNGILGLDIDDKIVMEPKQVKGSFLDLNSSSQTQVNTFSALMAGGLHGGTASGEGVRGIACSDFFSACHTKYKVWVWGANRGQMMNKEAKNTIVDDPVMVFESSMIIKSIAACDSALILLLENGQITALKNDRAFPLAVGKPGKTAVAAVEIKARGDYLAVLTADFKLTRFNLSLGGESLLWTARHTLDRIKSFDIGESGGAVVATSRGVYRVEDKGGVTELRAFRGVEVSEITYNLHGYLAISRISINLSDVKSDFAVKWSTENGDNDGDLELSVDGAMIRTHRAVLYARCPTLRSLLTATNTQSFVGVPSGSAIFRQQSQGRLLVEHAPLTTVRAFVKTLYLSNDSKSRTEADKIASSMHAGPELYEFNALCRLMARDLAVGLWDAKQAGMSCDVRISPNNSAHKHVLSAASPVLAARLDRWETGEHALHGLALGEETVEDVLRFIYTGEFNAAIDLLPVLDQAERLFALWQAADILLIPQLVSQCEDRLGEMIDYELIIPFLEITLSVCKNSSSRLATALLNCAAKQIQFLLPQIKDMENDTAAKLEQAFNVGEKIHDVSLNLPALAGKFSSLKSQSQLQRPAVKSKGRKLSSSLDKSEIHNLNPPMVQGNAQDTPKKTAATETPQKQAPTIKLVQSSKLVPQPVRAASQPGPLNTPVTPLTSSLHASNSKPKKEEGWIQAGKKTRTGSSTQDRNLALNGVAKTTLSPPAGSSSSAWGINSSSSPSPGSSTAFSSAWSASGSAGTPSPGPSAGPPRSGPSVTPVRPTPTRQPVNTRQPALSPLASLPKLGESLPTLGSKPPMANSSKKVSRPKFNQKGNKHVMSFDNPSSLAEQLDREAGESAPATPWKPVPVVQTHDTLQRLNRAKKPGSSVWGI